MSSIQLNDMTYTRNNVEEDFLRLLLNSSAILQNNALTENNLVWGVCFLREMSSIQLNDMTFTRNNVTRRFLFVTLNSSAILQNNTLTENNLGFIAYYLRKMSSIQLNDMTFTETMLRDRFCVCHQILALHSKIIHLLRTIWDG